MTLNAQASRQARDAGIAQVQLGRKEWMESAVMHAELFLRQNRGQELRAEQVRYAIQDRLPEPQHLNQWGAVAKALSRHKMWRPVGYAQSQGVSAKARVTRVYKVTI